MTLTEIKTAVASYLGSAASDLTVNSQDLFLVAVNEVRRNAEMQHDFEFQRKLCSVTVDGVTGGDLDNAVLYGTQTAAVIKTIVDVGIFDDDGNLRPAEWTTVAESLERQREENRFYTPRYDTTDADLVGMPEGRRRFNFVNDKVYRWPLDTTGADTVLGLECYVMSDEWASVESTSNTIWLTYGAQFLLWGTIVQLNHRFKYFVPRTEGNLPPPNVLRDEALASFIDWDASRYERYRRHGR